jgi:putative tRNA adenosine deaminase-associated protein
VSYFAAVLARGRDRWTATELDLDAAEDVEDVADLVRETEPGADLALLFVECEDEYLVVMRLDGDDDPRVFASDAAFAAESRVGEILLEGLEPAVGTADAAAGIDDPEEADAPAEDRDDDGDDDEDEDETPTLHPLGEADLLADLGTPAKDLLALCAHEGTLPADVMVELCSRAGCADALEELREA